MDGVVKMSAEERRLVCVQAEERLGLQAASIEKDFWVCWTLRELAARAGTPSVRSRSRSRSWETTQPLGRSAVRRTCKGGTSVSTISQTISRSTVK